MKIKIRTSLLIFSLLFVTISSAVYSLTASAGINNAVETRYKTYVSSVAKNEANVVRLYFKSLTTRVALLKAAPNVRSAALNSANEKQLRDVLGSYATEDSGVADISLYENGKVIFSLTGGGPLSQEISAVLDGGRLDQPYISKQAEYPLTIAVSTQLSPGRILTFAVNAENLHRLMLRPEFPKDVAGGRLMLIDPADFLFSSDDESDTRRTHKSLFGSIPEYIDNTVPNFELVNDDADIVGGVYAVEGTNWKVAAYSDISEAVSYCGGKGSMSFMAAAVILIFGLAGVVFSVLFTLPLTRLADAVYDQMQGGRRTLLPFISDNEYGNIAQAFAELLDDIHVSLERYRAVTEMSEDIIFEWDVPEDKVVFTGGFNKKFSYRAPTDRFSDSFLLKCKVHTDDRDRYFRDIGTLADGFRLDHNEYRMKDLYGDYVWVLIRTATVFAPSGAVSRVIGVIVDIDRAKKNERVLETKASFDALTELYNRETMYNLICNEIELVSLRKGKFSIFFIDVDNFKFYNDNYSHATGNQVLTFISRTIQDCIRDKGFAGRYGGDEFVMCVRDTDRNDPAAVIEKIMARLKEGFDCDLGDHLSVNISVGIANVEDSSKSIDEIVEMSDEAMYNIKKSGKSNYAFIN